MGRIKCDVLDRNRERELNRIATKGVVKFFNVCNNQQKDLETKIKSVGSSERKKDKILSSIDKGSFLSKLKNVDDENNSENEFKTISSTQNKKPTWSVLRDDFIMGAGMKDWDKKNSDGADDEDED